MLGFPKPLPGAGCAFFGALAAAFALMGAPLAAHADEATIAVAANFAAPAEALQKIFEQRTAHHLKFASGSTGQLYAQITHGAPLDALLSADAEHVDQLIGAGLADGTLRFTYAVGKLALWTRETDKFKPLDLKSLARDDFRWLAIANPELAPYGFAAEQALRKLGLWDSLQSRIVRGESIVQTFALAETRNADLAFVALSQVIAYRDKDKGAAAWFEVPQEIYDPIKQDAVLLQRASGNAAARGFLEFLRTPDAVRVIQGFGYGTEPATPTRERPF
jgi:molybdate transport system substrate-binding protein